MAVTLKELVNAPYIERPSDLQIIKHYFTENDLEEEAIQMISELSESKVAKLKLRLENIDTWATYLPSTYLYKEYDLEIADKLHMMELDYLINEGKITSKKLKWAKENAPNILEPEAYFQPLIRYLKENGIKFKEREED